MKLFEIMEAAWAFSRDNAQVDSDRLWPKDQMKLFINRTYRQIARETLCIRDSTTVSITQISSDPVDYTTYTAGTRDYIWANDPENWLYHKDVSPYLFGLDPLILSVDEVKWAKRAWKLTKVSSQKWQTNPFWERVIGMPTEYATDLEQGKIAVNFRDQTSDVLMLVVRRMPQSSLSAEGDTPEFREAYHDFFLNGVLAQMYLKQDVEAFDQGKADYHAALFARDIDEIKQKESKLEQTLGANGAHMAFL